ncbi:hypothetical protein [Methylocapsa palsarum]|uniref:Uncharacterized protein n=1 Tax=Methylocapsa palsarum TaxID=1612308 RepID=A0A1I3XAT4_9HYPH|nr:hypothetical protein [Methylocapsa palsarum]SFK16742.1 hypothetical protein SAMN05444581_1031 [Methylocapsa palsarum]
MNDNPSSEVRKLNAIEEASALVRAVAEPCPPGDSVKAAIVRARRRLGWSYSRTRAVWYADLRIRLAAYELDDLRAKALAPRVEKERDRYESLIDRIGGTGGSGSDNI